MKKLLLKDKKRRFSVMIVEKKLLILKYIFQNLNLEFSIREFAYKEFQHLIGKTSQTKIRNRCVFSNRARGIYRFFKISRLFFKQYALEGNLNGIKKASW